MLRASSLAAAVLLAALGSSAQAAIGKTSGHFEVTSSGSASYTVPLWTPPGVNGLQPRIAVRYDSCDAPVLLRDV